MRGNGGIIEIRTFLHLQLIARILFRNVCLREVHRCGERQIVDAGGGLRAVGEVDGKDIIRMRRGDIAGLFLIAYGGI